MILSIERDWGQTPGWFATLDHEAQVVLLAEHRVRHGGSKASGPGDRTRKMRASKR